MKTYRLYAVSEVAAQALADKAHAFLIANNPAYAGSVARGETLRWAKPKQELDKDGKPFGEFYIEVEDKCIDCFTGVEQQKLDQAGKDFLAARVAK